MTSIWHTDTQLYFHLCLSGHTSIAGVITQTGPHWLEKKQQNLYKQITKLQVACKSLCFKSLQRNAAGIGRCHYLKECISTRRVYTYPADTTENMQKRLEVSMKASPAGEKVQLALILVCTSRISGMLPNMVLISSCASIGPPSCPSFSNGTWNNWWIKEKKH